MNNLKFESSEGEPNPEYKRVLVEGMLAHHKNSGHQREVKTFSVFAKDESNKVIGGVIVSFLWNGMEIQALWVDQTARKQGLGRKLMEMVEEEGIKRGCTISYTNTFSWQAPEFYAKLGYSVYGKLDDFPPGNSLTYFQKNLS